MLYPNTYMILFRMPHGEQELEVPGEIYIALDEGQEGMLIFKGERFHNFVPASNDPL